MIVWRAPLSLSTALFSPRFTKRESTNGTTQYTDGEDPSSWTFYRPGGRDEHAEDFNRAG